MSFWEWLRPRRYLLALFLAITLVPLALLIYFGGRMLQQERTLALDGLRQRRDQAADLIVVALEERLKATERSLRERRATLTEELSADADAVRVVFAAGEPGTAGKPSTPATPPNIEAFPAGRLLFYPVVTPLPQAPERILAPGEELEYRSGDFMKAAAWYRDLARSSDPAVRAAALMGVARNHKKAGKMDAALAAYAEARDLRNVAVNGVPADLFARWAACDLLATLGRADQLRGDATALYTDLTQGRWQMTRAEFEFRVADAERWLGADRPPPPPPARVAIAAGVESLWVDWRRLPAADDEISGRDAANVTRLWTGDRRQLAALVAGPSFVEGQWMRMSKLTPLLEGQQLKATLRNAAERMNDTAGSQRLAVATGLPWTVVVEDVDLAQELARLGDGRRLWLWGLAIVVVFVTAGTVVIARAVTRDVALARLQSDFVSAVSHEFRTPLTSMRQLTEVLIDDRTPSEARRRDYYLALARQTNRLHRLVESLLDFGRMEANRSTYQLEPLDVSAWIRSVVEQFGTEAEGRGYRVELDVDGATATVDGDRDALTTALWNLLDNAVKYSPECRTVWVDVELDGLNLAIRVRDRGVGIPPAEQRDIFQRFVRGARAKADGIRGTGIGLAMVAHIVRGHGGEVRVESAPGSGSTFTIVLPAHT